MDQLAPSHVPMYETTAEGRELWERCAGRGLPVVAIRESERGYVVRYDLSHLDAELSERAIRNLRGRVRSPGSYTFSVDPLSETERVGGGTGQVAGELHAATERDARRLASHVSAFVFDADDSVR